jgi:hypothetical protein
MRCLRRWEIVELSMRCKSYQERTDNEIDDLAKMPANL